MCFIQPGEPQQNAFVERFNRTYRHEVLNAYVFDTLEQARLISEGWVRLYNEDRPHRALGRLPPASGQYLVVVDTGRQTRPPWSPLPSAP